MEQKRLQPRHHETEQERSDIPLKQARVSVSDIDSILDDIDAALEENATSFVQGFVQKGGQ